MSNPSGYNTKQREAILAYLASLDGGHVTAAEIAAHLWERDTAVGLTTIYRQLDRLETSGLVRKYILNGSSSACYQAVGGHGCNEHFHLKCEDCGDLIHLRCDQLDSLASHFSRDHGFSVDAGKTVFYGVCQQCGGKK